MKYMKNKYSDENGNIISFWSTDDNVLCEDGKTLRENLNNKADKNEVFTMANMGQDIKDAMTGGSVAVVGKNTILTDNIVDGQVTPYKTNFVEYGNNILNIDELVDGYVYSNGEIKNGNYVTTTYIPFSKGDKINLSRMDKPGINKLMTRRAIRTACFYDSSYNVLSDFYYNNTGSTAESVTYQGKGNVAYIRVSFQKTLVDNAMLYLGDERKEYEKNGVIINKLKLNENLKEEIETKIKIDNNVLKDKTIINFGDSIGAGDGNNGAGYAELLAKKNDMTCYDYAVGGATITTSTNDILTQIEKAKNDKKTADYILFDGFTNDINNGAVKELGKISDGYSQTKDINTFSGAFEEICFRLKTYWKGTPIFYVCVHKMSSRNTELQNTYSTRAKTLCERWSIPVIDIYNEGGLNTYIADYKTLYTNNADGTHPNELGYNTFYVPLIEKNLKGGVTSSSSTVSSTNTIVQGNDLKGAILNSNKNQIIDLQNKKITYSISENILVDSRTIANGTIEITGGAKVILKNENPILHNLKIINKCESNGLNNGVIELLNTTDAVIDNVEMELSTKYSGVFCKTRATNTRINNLKINGNLRYGILFNDSCTEQGATFRTVDGVDYSDATIGSGLYINNYSYKNTVPTDDTTYDGDGIEINCPDFGFSDIRINNADIENARHIGGASGMALGFSNCKNMTCYNINSKNCGFDGIHFENKCENVYVYNLIINECSRGISIGSCKNINIINAVVADCTIWLAMSNLHSNNEEIKLQNVTFNGNKVVNSSVAPQAKGFEINDMKDSVFRDIFITNSGATGYGFLNLGLSKYLKADNTNSNGYIDIQGCTFENVRIKAGTHTIANSRKLMVLGDNSKGNTFRNIKLEGYNAEDLMDFSSKKYKFENYLVDYEFVSVSDIILVNILNTNNYVNSVIGADGSITDSAENYAFKIPVENGKRYGLFRLDGNSHVISWTPRVSITDDKGTVLDKYISTTNDVTINNEKAKYMYVFNPGWNLTNYATAMVLKNYKGSSPVKYIEYETNL